MNNMDEIQNRLEELIDDLIEATGGELPLEHRLPNESGEEAYLREIHNRLNWIQQILYDLE